MLTTVATVTTATARPARFSFSHSVPRPTTKVHFTGHARGAFQRVYSAAAHELEAGNQIGLGGSGSEFVEDIASSEQVRLIDWWEIWVGVGVLGTYLVTSSQFIAYSRTTHDSLRTAHDSLAYTFIHSVGVNLE